MTLNPHEIKNQNQLISNTDILFVSHGGGPLPLLDDPAHRDMVAALKMMAQQMPKPDAVLIISAHWEAKVVSLTVSTQPPLIYDYSGFPPESYTITYPALGHPALAAAVQQCIEHSNIPTSLNTERGLDHGVFVPLKIMYPEADVACVQLSLVQGLDASLHLQIGEALAQLDVSALGIEQLLILGSGFSFHNMGEFFHPSTDSHMKNMAFEAWLYETLSSHRIDEASRRQRLIDWQDAPFARFSHPREEHLMPLHVCYGAAGRASDSAQDVKILGKHSGMYYWHGKR